MAQPKPGKAVISEAMTVHGEVIGGEELTIAGKVRGRIVVEEQVIIEHGAFVEADVEARTIVVRGQVMGSLNALERIDILQSAEVSARLSAPTVVVEEGARLLGSVEMSVDLPVELRSAAGVVS